jgi:hypothetical protein
LPFRTNQCVRLLPPSLAFLSKSFQRTFVGLLANVEQRSICKFLLRWATAATILATVAMAQSITLSSPVNGATVGSPVQFVATANGGSHPVSAIWIYIDNQPAIKTNTASLNGSLALATGSHKVVATMWNSVGQLASQMINITVSPAAAASNSQYQNDFNAVSKWASTLPLADGGLPYTTTNLSPYFANIAAHGMTKDPARMPEVVAWMNWYINHLNWPDKWGLYGTVYDYTVSNGVPIPTDDADSTDSYAATFLTLAWNAWQTGDANARSYIAGLSYQLDVIGGVIILTQQSDGLTWAKPDYQIKYLMDNCEVYRGLRDLASLYQNGFGDATKAAWYNAAADRSLAGILTMWQNGKWAPYKDGAGNMPAPNLGTWYPDSAAQVFPMLMGVVAPSDTRAQQTYANFNAAWPGWPTLSFNSQDPFPWGLVADAAATMGDNARVATYINSIQSKYVNTGFPWPFYTAEVGWFMRANNYMLGRGL